MKEKKGGREEKERGRKGKRERKEKWKKRAKKGKGRKKEGKRRGMKRKNVRKKSAKSEKSPTLNHTAFDSEGQKGGHSWLTDPTLFVFPSASLTAKSSPAELAAKERQKEKKRKEKERRGTAMACEKTGGRNSERGNNCWRKSKQAVEEAKRRTLGSDKARRGCPSCTRLACEAQKKGVRSRKTHGTWNARNRPGHLEERM